MKMFGDLLFAAGSLGMALGGIAVFLGLVLTGRPKRFPAGLRAFIVNTPLGFGLSCGVMGVGVATLGWAIRRRHKPSK
jgi:hypothetical protein